MTTLVTFDMPRTWPRTTIRVGSTYEVPVSTGNDDHGITANSDSNHDDYRGTFTCSSMGQCAIYWVLGFTASNLGWYLKHPGSSYDFLPLPWRKSDKYSIEIILWVWNVGLFPTRTMQHDPILWCWAAAMTFSPQWIIQLWREMPYSAVCWVAKLGCLLVGYSCIFHLWWVC
jgi:hypothetical protein